MWRGKLLDEDLETENESLKHRVESQSERIDNLEDRVEKNDQSRTDLAKNANKEKSKAEQAKEIARSASAKTCQVEATLEEIESSDTENETPQLPGDVEPSTSPLNFFANCRSIK